MKINEKALKKFARLYLARKKMKTKLSVIQQRLDKMEQVLLPHLQEVEANSGLDLSTLSLPGGLTFDQRETIWAKFPEGREAAIEALKKAGFKDRVAENFDSNSISALLRELDQQNKIPDEFEGVIVKNPVTKLIPRKL